MVYEQLMLFLFYLVDTCFLIPVLLAMVIIFHVPVVVTAFRYATLQMPETHFGRPNL